MARKAGLMTSSLVAKAAANRVKPTGSPDAGTAAVAPIRRAVALGGTLDDLWRRVVRDVLNDGDAVQGGSGRSVGAQQLTKELLNYGADLANARQRLLYNPRRGFNIAGAVGRFVWMMSGSDRLADIAYYEPRVRDFSDDGLTVPGSSYGTRLFSSQPGLDQIANVISTLRRDRHSRRAAAAVFRPEDSGRDSRDIPCNFGVAYNIRRDQLHATTMMRSNNVWALPYNVFEFSFLAEVVAASVGVEVGPYHHWAISMHIYARDFEAAEGSLKVEFETNVESMPPMPLYTASDDVGGLLQFEVDLRTTFAGLNGRKYKRWIREDATLNDYWRDYGLVLLIHALRKAERIDLAQKVLPEVGQPFGAFLSRDFGPLFEKSNVAS